MRIGILTFQSTRQESFGVMAKKLTVLGDERFERESGIGGNRLGRLRHGSREGADWFGDWSRSLANPGGRTVDGVKIDFHFTTAGLEFGKCRGLRGSYRGCGGVEAPLVDVRNRV